MAVHKMGSNDNGRPPGGLVKFLQIVLFFGILFFIWSVASDLSRIADALQLIAGRGGA